jgi:hypothetical protein
MDRPDLVNEYATEIQNGNFGRKYQRILLEGRTKRLEEMQKDLQSQKIQLSLEEIAARVVEMNFSRELCNERRVVGYGENFIKFKNFKKNKRKPGKINLNPPKDL